MSEPGVALTDYLLALECAILALLLLARRGVFGNWVRWPVIFFAASGLAALAGGTAHGFFPDESSRGFGVVWLLTMLSIGAAAVALAKVAVMALGNHGRMRWLDPLLAIAALVYALVILWLTHAFWVAIAVYLPATVFLLFGFSVRYVRERRPALVAGLLGVTLSLVAAAVQRSGWGLHPVWLDHNALYHLIQALGLLLVFFGMREMLRSCATTRSSAISSGC